MKDFRRILAVLMAVLLLCGTMGAFADAEAAPGAARTVGNDDEGPVREYFKTLTMGVGQKMVLAPPQSSNTGRFSATLTSSDPNIVGTRGKTITALAPGRCTVVMVIAFQWRKLGKRVTTYDITVVGGPELSANGKTLKDDEVIRLKVHKTLRLEVVYLNALGVKSWSSSDPSMLRIKTGKAVCSFVPLKPGKCTITVRLDDGTKLACRVVVTA